MTGVTFGSPLLIPLKTQLVIITGRMRNMGEDTVFTGMCHSFCPQRG